jgi:hypothetical protein
MAYNDTPETDWHERSPLTLAMTRDEGKTWQKLVTLAPAPATNPTRNVQGQGRQAQRGVYAPPHRNSSTWSSKSRNNAREQKRRKAELSAFFVAFKPFLQGVYRDFCNEFAHLTGLVPNCAARARPAGKRSGNALPKSAPAPRPRRSPPVAFFSAS